MVYYFDPCPDCGEYYGKVGNIPKLDRHTKIYSGDSVVKSRVRAVCNRCGWETKSHDNVGECAKEWNNTKLYEEEVEEEFDCRKLASHWAGKALREIRKYNRTGELLYEFVKQLRFVSRMYAYRGDLKEEFDFEIVPADEYKKLKGEQ